MAKRKKRDAGFAQQPHVVRILVALRSKRGTTIEEIADGREPHSIRAVFSRLRTVAGVDIAITRDPKRGNVYRVRR